jgi:hypothetical protein
VQPMISGGDAPRFLVPAEKVDAYLRRRHHWGDSRRAATALVGLGMSTGARIDEAVAAGTLEVPESSPPPGGSGNGKRRRRVPAADSRHVPPPRRPRDLDRTARRALDDFGFFRRRYLGRVPSPWQEDAAARMVGWLETPRKEFVVVNTAPGVGKTTLFCHDLIVWLICRNRRIRVLVGSRSEALAARSTGRIRRTLERTTIALPSEEDLRRGLAVVPTGVLPLEFGRFRPARSGPAGEADEESRNRWTRSGFQVEPWEGESTTEKEDTVAAWGFDSRKLGPRLDLIAWDDLEDTRGIRSREGTTNLRMDYDNEAETRLDPGGLLLLQGQRLGPGDIHRHCLDKLVPVVHGEEESFDPALWVPTTDAGGVDGGGAWSAPLDALLSPAAEGDGMPVALEPWRHDGAGIVGWRRRYHHITYPAHFEDRCVGHHSPDAPAALDPRRPGGCLLDPARLPFHELLAEAHANPTKYRVLYQQEDVDPEGVLVKRIWVDGGKDPTTGEVHPGCWDPTRGRADIPPAAPQEARSVLSIDPSPARWWSIQWWLYDPPTERQWLLDLARRPLTAPGFLDWDHDEARWVGLLEEWWQRSRTLGRRYSHVIVEANAAQRFLLAYAHVRRWSSERSVSIVPHITGPWKADPERGPEILSPHWRFGRVRLPGSVVGGGREVSDPLVSEVTRYSTAGDSPTTDDCVMAQWFLNHQAPILFPQRRTQGPTLLRRPTWLRTPAEPANPLFARSN